ncbi:hypothetical protein [Geminocystis sp.]|uniref:hypothetical protein n=1 Tax=Geminocystis sp. TaxID=2664100 RepID=UPI0035941DA9
MSQFTKFLTTSAIVATAFIVANPLTAQAIPQKSRGACVARTAEEFGVSVFNVVIESVGPVSAESGATTLLMKKKKREKLPNVGLTPSITRYHLLS